MTDFGLGIALKVMLYWLSYSIICVAFISFLASQDFFRLLITFANRLDPDQTRGYKAFSMLNSAEHKINPAHNVKMPTIVGILSFISKINTTSQRLSAVNLFICRYFSFYEQLKFRAQLSRA